MKQTGREQETNYQDSCRRIQRQRNRVCCRAEVTYSHVRLSVVTYVEITAVTWFDGEV